MAANGEERILTLFADVHYYFGVPGPRPVNHRFDKESYVYLYRDAAQQRGRLEIANHAGTPEQDAFTGYLDNCRIVQSNRHPNLVTITVDGLTGSVPAQPNEHHWRLPSTDPRDEGKYLFRLHTLDLYFWTVEDSYSFVRGAQQTLKAEQLSVDALAPTHHGDSMSPVVQQLENVAVTDPAYMNGKTRDSRATSTTLAGSVSSPGPSTQAASQAESRKEQDPAVHAPLAYNPAAPPAPEEIKHREKTPPPPEAAVVGTGLAAAAYSDHLQAQGRQMGTLSAPPPGYAPVGQPPHPGVPSATTPYASPVPPKTMSPQAMAPQPAAGHRASNAGHNYAPGPTSSASPMNAAHNPVAAAAPPYSPGDPNAHLYSQNNKPLDSPTAQILGTSYPAGRGQQPLQHLQPQYANYLASHSPPQNQPPQAQPYTSASVAGPIPIGGYSSYRYDQELLAHQHHHHPHSAGGAPGNPYATGDPSIHTQVYRPTEDEAGGYGQKPGRHGSKSDGSGPGQAPGKLEEKALKAEKGINKFLRKVEKKIG